MCTWYRRRWGPAGRSRGRERVACRQARARGWPPTLAQLLRHAQLFGADQVYETAQAFLGERALARLRIELDASEAGRKSGRLTVGKRRRRSTAETGQAVLALSAEGLIASAIADKLGLSDETVKLHLRATGATAR